MRCLPISCLRSCLWFMVCPREGAPAPRRPWMTKKGKGCIPVLAVSPGAAARWMWSLRLWHGNQVAMMQDKAGRGVIKDWRTWRCARDRVAVFFRSFRSPPWGKAPCPLCNDEGETHQSNCYVVVPAGIGTTLEVVEPELAFELFMGAFGSMAFLDQADQLHSGRAPGQSDQLEFARCSLARRHLQKQPELLVIGTTSYAVDRPDPAARKPRHRWRTTHAGVCCRGHRPPLLRYSAIRYSALLVTLKVISTTNGEFVPVADFQHSHGGSRTD